MVWLDQDYNLQGYMKITVTNDKQSLHIQGEFTAAIHGHIMLIKHRIVQTVLHSVHYVTWHGNVVCEDNNNNEKGN